MLEELGLVRLGKEALAEDRQSRQGRHLHYLLLQRGTGYLGIWNGCGVCCEKHGKENRKADHNVQCANGDRAKNHCCDESAGNSSEGRSGHVCESCMVPFGVVDEGQEEKLSNQLGHWCERRINNRQERNAYNGKAEADNPLNSRGSAGDQQERNDDFQWHKTPTAWILTYRNLPHLESLSRNDSLGNEDVLNAFIESQSRELSTYTTDR